MNQGPTGAQPMQIDVSKLETIECPKCQNTFFLMLQELKKVSALISPTGKAEILPVQYLACSGCSTVVDVDMNGNVTAMSESPEDIAADIAKDVADSEGPDTPSSIIT